MIVSRRDPESSGARVRVGRRLLRLLWPAFLVAAAAEAVFFSVFDPFDLHFLGAPLEMSRLAVYTMGFFGFWGMGFASAALAAFLNGDLDRP